jgi:hypothetical protein
MIMNELPDLEPHPTPRTPVQPPPQPTHPGRVLLAIALLIAASCVAFYLAFEWRPSTLDSMLPTQSQTALQASQWH